MELFLGSLAGVIAGVIGLYIYGKGLKGGRQEIMQLYNYKYGENWEQILEMLKEQNRGHPLFPNKSRSKFMNNPRNVPKNALQDNVDIEDRELDS